MVIYFVDMEKWTEFPLQLNLTAKGIFTNDFTAVSHPHNYSKCNLCDGPLIGRNNCCFKSSPNFNEIDASNISPLHRSKEIFYIHLKEILFFTPRKKIVVSTSSKFNGSVARHNIWALCCERLKDNWAFRSFDKKAVWNNFYFLKML